MLTQHSKRYCADPEALAAMKRDGLGWGHDLGCGCFQDISRSTKPSVFARVITAFKRRM
ncbi:hypothetical protein [Yoonia sp.]|uniref:hypothetical protein n=1 Tax=Yoonia sp. TaxID=2212373 RepID=UPI0035C7B62D